MGDFVKGKQLERYTAPIQAGIKLHRFIDHYTDTHAVVHEVQELLRPEFRISSGVFIDIFFDHFLANHTSYFTEERLSDFTAQVYQHILSYQAILSEDMRTFFGYMQQYNWLYHYHTREGISKSVHGMCKRYPKLGNPEAVMQLFDLHYIALQTHFNTFFPKLESATFHKYEELLSLEHG